MRNSGNDAAVATALVAGLAVGAVLAVLFAPDSGRNVRRRIGEQGGGLASGIKDIYGSLRAKINGASEEAADAATEHEVPHFKKQVQKKPKSDIKEILHEAHADEPSQQQEEQS
ncbi:hypothetical protein C7T94_12615 [Pedobacter yulinensis]|uniref:YtxH domain-containing protein n=2 Tax=Pedobacter yulinensis TaxID=2126353 RepID=A0A2T3HN80_9SPHI|nr:hypothetical protein C7T94_12615 [Pedobacter yulinensis]